MSAEDESIGNNADLFGLAIKQGGCTGVKFICVDLTSFRAHAEPCEEPAPGRIECRPIEAGALAGMLPVATDPNQNPLQIE